MSEPVHTQSSTSATSATSVTSTQSATPAAAQVDVRKRRGISIIWLIPLIAAGIGGWLAYRSITEKGPTITLTFETATGLEAGKTAIKYKAVEVGTVNTVRLSEDISKVMVTATLDKGTEEYLTEGTQFWVERPRVGAGGISGLSTIVSGAYINFAPGDGTPVRTFTGLERPPLTPTDTPGLRITLKAEKLGSLHIGAPVYFRQIQVGKVEDDRLAPDHQYIEIDVFIEQPYAQLVRQHSRFWNASGIDVSVGLTGVSVSTESFESLVVGGIAFETPHDNAGDPVENGAVYPLYSQYEDIPRPAAEIDADPQGVHFVLTAEELGSVATDTPLYYRHLQVGHVTHTELNKKASGVRIHIDVKKQHAALVRKNTVFWDVSGIHANLSLFDSEIDIDSVRSLLQGGIAFSTPSRKGKPARAGATFPLHAKAPQSVLKKSEEKGVPLVLTADRLGSIADDAPVYYREFQVGRVTKTQLSPDDSGVRIHLDIDSKHAHLVRQNTVFWNASGIHANLSLFGSEINIESLRSLLQGGIAFSTPPKKGKRVQAGAKFPLYTTPPDGISEEPKDTGFQLILTAERLGSVKKGEPVYYRQFEVGQVTDTRLSPNASAVQIHLAIQRQHAHLVQTNSVFWNASGVHADFNLFDPSIDIESLQSVVEGGIAFANPSTNGKRVKAGIQFPLHSKRPKHLFAHAENPGLQLVLKTDQLGSVADDDLIYYREVPVGRVVRTQLANDASSVDVHIVIDKPYAALVRRNTVFWNASGIDAKFRLFGSSSIRVESLRALLEGGIAFATPNTPGAPATSGMAFTLHGEADDDWLEWTPRIQLAKR